MTALMPTVRERIEEGRFVSFELWPPRTPDSAQALEDALSQLTPLGPAFVAITYGAGGSTRERTHDLVVRLVGTPLLPLAHLTCAAHHRGELVDLMQRYRRAGVDNLLALHGDPPLSATQELPEGDLRYARDLVALAREQGFPCVGVAVHAEGHPAATSRDQDLARQAAKLRDADFALTQFLHRADDYERLVEELTRRGAGAPIVPGVMPITNVRQVERMAQMSGTSIPVELAAKLQAVADDPAEVRKAGVEHATELCRALLDAGAPGLHFYTMNRAAATLEVCANLGWERVPDGSAPR
jgi:methylenetetrahydrofolate reductase (NADPH)